MDNQWTIKAALEWTEGYLAEKGDENPRVSAQWLLSEATGLSRTQLFMSYDKPLTPDERALLRDYVARRGAGEPLQYITGEVTFRYIPVKVRPGVLIPRPETEVLVSEVLAALPAPAKREAKWNEDAAAQESEAVEAVKKAVAEAAEALAENQRAANSTAGDPARSEQGEGEGESEGAAAGAGAAAYREGAESAVSVMGTALGGVAGSEPSENAAPRPLLVADLCTGTGCIACSLAYEHPDVRVIATDISSEASALARENAEALELSDRVAVLECSLGTGIGEKRMGTFDAVVSNPPYVPTAVLAQLPREVADFEPKLALDGGADGLDLFRPLAAWAARALREGGFLACELHEGHMDAAADAARQAGFDSVRIVSDLAGRSRVLTAVKPAR